MVYLHGWYNACYAYARRRGLLRSEWKHVSHEHPGRVLRGQEGGLLVLCYGWTLEGMELGDDRGMQIETAPGA